MITYGDSIVHGRSQLSVNESIGILTIDLLLEDK